MQIPNNIQTINKQICTTCMGKCCKHCGCVYSPDNFETMSYKYLREVIEQGAISISTQFTGNDKNISYYLYLRARNINRDIVDLFTVKTTCLQLTENGCRFEDNKRPQGGILYIPKENYQCQRLYTDRIAQKEWSNYQKVLERLVRYFSNKTSLEKLKENIIETAYYLATKSETNTINIDDFSKEETEAFNTLNIIIPTFENEVREGFSLAKKKIDEIRK